MINASNTPALLAIAIGNTRTRIGIFHGTELIESASHPNAHALENATTELDQLVDSPAAAQPIVAIADVNRALGDQLEKHLREHKVAPPVLRLGDDVPIDLNCRLDEEGAQTVGQDRLLCAIGAYSRTQQATAIVDAGTCITVDFVDGEGTFCGGAIAPGLNMMLQAMPARTALPKVDFKLPPENEPFGPNTPDAMRLGVTAALRGMTRNMVERFAIYYEAYPQVVATGGNANILEGDELIEHIVPDLQLIGLQVCVARALMQAE